MILRGRGLDSVHVLEIGVTLDHDFHTHLALAGQGRPSVILLRIERIGAAAQADLIETICSFYFPQYGCGSGTAAPSFLGSLAPYFTPVAEL